MKSLEQIFKTMLISSCAGLKHHPLFIATLSHNFRSHCHDCFSSTASKYLLVNMSHVSSIKTSAQPLSLKEHLISSHPILEDVYKQAQQNKKIKHSLFSKPVKQSRVKWIMFARVWANNVYPEWDGWRNVRRSAVSRAKHFCTSRH